MDALTSTASSKTANTNTAIKNSSSSLIATAPQVPSSSNLNYYDPRHFNSASTATLVEQSLYMNPSSDMNSVSSANIAAAAAGLGPNSSLPPLSHLLAAKTNSNGISTDHVENIELVTSSAHHDDMEYFNPSSKHHSNGANFVQPQHYSTSAPVISHQHLASYSKSIVTQSRRNNPSNQQHNGYYMMPTHSITTHYGQLNAVPNGMAPSVDLSEFPPSSQHYQGMYHSCSRNHGHLPSPPTSVIDGGLFADPNIHRHLTNGAITNNSQKVFSFVPLPGLNQKKRPRRKFNEVERLYQCSFQNCSKSYGTLNHLNAHVSMQRHGPKRQPSEFKELRKIWRKQKRDNKQCTNSRSTTQSLEDDEHVFKYEQDSINVTESSILNHSTNMIHHEYNPSMPPYMQQLSPHPSSMSHPPPPPPPPPPPSAHWMERSHQYHHAAEFIPSGY